MNDYEKQAQDFLNETGATIIIDFLKHGKHFEDDKESLDIYTVTIKKGGRQYTFNFGNSIAHSGRFLVGYKMAPGVKMRNHICFNDKKQAEAMAYKTLLGERKNVVENPDFKVPTAYDVLACLTKYDPGNLDDFCSEFGYDIDSKKAEGIYLAVKNEYENLCRLFSDEELKKMQEIQ